MSNKKNKVHVKSGLVIEKNVAPPEGRSTNPFTQVARDLEINDSVLVDKVPSSISATAKRLGVKFAARKEDGKFRIWRVR